jgi:hypothetical protein
MSDRRLNEPLAPDEAELAQRLHVLPGGVPSAHVDAAILAAARAPRPKAPRSLWWLALSSAASLVLVVGLVSQWNRSLSPAAEAPPPAQSPSAPAAPEQAAQEIPAMPDPVPAPLADTPQPARAAPPAEPLTEITVSGTHVTTEAEAGSAAGKARETPPQPAATEAPASMAIQAPPPAAPALRQDALRERLAAPADASNASAAAGGAELAAEADAIRALLADGRRELARQRLLDLIERHPQWPVPPDLQALRE